MVYFNEYLVSRARGPADLGVNECLGEGRAVSHELVNQRLRLLSEEVLEHIQQRRRPKATEIPDDSG